VTFRESPPSPDSGEGGGGTPSMDTAAQKFLEKLDADGRLSAEELEKAARNPNNPLHERLVWDNEVAGYRHRIEQCRTIIRSYRVLITVNKRSLSVPIYIHDVTKSEEGGYISAASLRDRSTEDQHATLLYEFSRALTCVQRAASIAESIGSDVDASRVLKGLEKIVDSLSPPAEEVA